MDKLNNNQTMTSLRIAEISGKEHKNVMASIRIMEPAWKKVAGLKFKLGYYTDENNQQRPMYELSYDESLYVASKYDNETRAKIIKHWSELRKEKETTQNTFALPPKDISKLIEEENQKYEKQLEAINTDINKYFISLSNIPEFREYNSLLSQKKGIVDMITENNKAIKINARHKNKILTLDT